MSADAIMADMFGVFNEKASDVTLAKEEKAGSNFFNPNSREAKNQTWRGIIKFIPNLHGDTHTITKVSYRIQETENRSFRYDSAKSVSRYENCPVSDTYWALAQSKNAQEKQRAKKIRYQKRTFALIQVIKDLQNPENEGKIMVWDVPLAIQKKMNAKLYPSQEDIELGSEPNNIFNPIAGLPMKLNIPIKNTAEGEFRDYDSCEFAQDPIAIILEGQKAPVKLSSDAEELKSQQEEILKTILAGPNLEDMAYKPADEATMTRVKNALHAIKTGTIPASTVETETAQPAQPAQEVKTEKVESVKEPEPKAEVKEAVQSEPAQPEQEKSDDDDELEALLNG